MHQLHKLFNRNNFKVSNSFLSNFKSVISSHNKNELSKKENLFQCNCSVKTSRPLHVSCRHKNLVYSRKFSISNIKKNDPHYICLTEHTFQNSLYKYNNSAKYESKGNWIKVSNFIRGKKKEKFNVNLDWSLLDKEKLYSPTSNKFMLCLTEKYKKIFYIKNLLNKGNELVTKCRHENKFYLANYREIAPQLLFWSIFTKTIINNSAVNSVPALKIF